MANLSLHPDHHSPFAPLRREDIRLLRGEGRFVHDLAGPGLWHVAFARSGHACGTLSRLDATLARAMPGVLAVLDSSAFGTHNMPAINALLPVAETMATFPLMAAREVSHVGQVLAMVVAETAEQAWLAAQAVEHEVVTRGMTPRLDLSRDEPTLDADIVTRVAFSAGVTSDVSPATTVSARLKSPRVVAMSMEPRATVAKWDPALNALTLWTGTQAPSRAQEDVARCLGVEKAQVRVICPDVGGAFGAKASVYPEDLLVALAARQLEAHLSWTSRRSDEFTSAMHGRGSSMTGELALDEQGRFLSLRADLSFSLGAWLAYSAVVPLRNAARILPGPYRVAQLDVKGRAALSNSAPVNIYRGAGRPEAALLMETLIERAARKGGIDPVALRRLNLIAPELMPYTTPSGECFDSGNYVKALERACELFDYEGQRADQARRRAAGELLGIGVAMYVEPCGQGWESARVTLHGDGKVTVASGTPAQGQGHESTFARIAADALGCAVEDVEVHCGDTGLCPQGIGALASRSTAIGGSAIVKACREVLQRKAEGEALPLTVETRETSAESWSYGCVIVRMSVERDTGQPHIEQCVWVDDAGTVIRPDLVKGQLLGGFAQGFGQAMMERIVYDRQGQLLSGSLMDYAVPRAGDLPAVEIESLCSPSPNNVLGAKGVGEAGCIGVPAALMNAAADALSPFGEPDLQFPLRAEQLWRVIAGRTPI